MDDNKNEQSAKSTLRKKSSLKKLTKLGKAIRKRLPKTPKTDRGPPSSTGSETGSMRGKKEGSLTSRIKKRFSSTPRRSVSFTDLDNLSQKEVPTEEDLDDEEPVFLATQSARPDFLMGPARDTLMPSEFESNRRCLFMFSKQGVVSPDTPVGSQPRIKQMSINSVNSGSFPNLQSGTEEVSETESRTGEIRRSRRPSCTPRMDDLNKEAFAQERTAPVVDSEQRDFLQQSAELFQYTLYNAQKEKEEEEEEALLDAAASIDVGIEETVFESLYRPNLVTATSAPKTEQEITEASPEEETTNETPKLEQGTTNETNKLEQGTTNETPKHEQEITEESIKPEQEITECPEPVKEVPRVTPREIGLPAMDRPSEVTPAEDEEEEECAPSKEVVKPRRSRFRRFLLREAPISLATLAVGILFLVFKSRGKGRLDTHTC